jgi:hypothetical protein
MKEIDIESPKEVDVDGRIDSKGVIFIGKAIQQPDGTWRCLANVGRALCVVEVKIAESVEGMAG